MSANSILNGIWKIRKQVKEWDLRNTSSPRTCGFPKLTAEKFEYENGNFFQILFNF